MTINNKKGGRATVETTALRLAEAKEGNVYLSFFAETTHANEVIFYWCSMRRVFSSYSRAGEAHSLESGDLDSAINLLGYSAKWFKGTRDEFLAVERWPYAFDPADAVRVGSIDAVVNAASNVVESFRSRDMVATLFSNETEGGDTVLKITLRRVLAGAATVTQTILPEHVPDAIAVLEQARAKVDEIELTLAYDDARKYLVPVIRGKK